MSKVRTVYYDNERENEFSGISRKTVRVGADFPFVRTSPLWRAAEFLVYRVLMKPVAYLWCKLKFGVRIIGREKLKKYGKIAYFIYSNHTLMAGDAFIPNLLDPKKRTYVIVHPDNISAKGTKNFTLMCGAIPLPTEPEGYRPFVRAVEKRASEGAMLCIYPEAHIWPYFTGIRDFSETSFSYPVRLKTPVFSSTVTYEKRKLTKIPRVTVYIDGPFYPDPELGLRDAQKKLRDEVHTAMTARARERSTYERIIYRKRGEKDAEK